MLNKWCSMGKAYVQNMELADIAAFKVCLLSLGTVLGVTLPKKVKRFAATVAALAFLVTYLPLMGKFFGLLFRSED